MDNFSSRLNSTVDCSDSLPHTGVYYTELGENVVEAVILSICLLLALVTIVTYLVDLLGRSYRYNDVVKRQRVLIILGIYPMTSSLACLALLVPKGTGLADLVQTCYLSICLYVFIELLIQYYGGKTHMVEVLSSAKIQLRSPPCCCCCCCLPSVEVKRITIKILRGLVMQVAIIRPTLLFIFAIIVTDNSQLAEQTSVTSPSSYLALVNAVSTLLAMYGLLVLVKVSREPLKEHKIRVKFILLQLVLLFTNLQSTVFLILSVFQLPPCRDSQGSKIRGSLINHMLLTVEMFLLFVAARRAYRKSEHRNLSEQQITVYGAVSSKTEDVDMSET